jgi:hypothetical protein
VTGRRLASVRLGVVRRVLRWPFVHPYQAVLLFFLVQLTLEKGL